MALIIRELLLDKKLDQQVMASVRDGFYFGSDTNSQSQGQPGAPSYNRPVCGGASDISIDNSPDSNPDSLAYLQAATKHSYI